ncbi:phosphoenolpyruvate--protein phosphotransferase [Phycicoccus sp. Soil803]|uniref:phosphoenolpyruvate--protein phosphotransferase n=1 Tax=Phycicoccus sp. Soil803 TaxID=1736415 RepID=UPI0009E747B9|nr:phosphoenolpyruvate--protein phosphotransferase [Phycicoccus sp. Soil803]
MTESTSANAPATDAERRVGLIVVSHSRALALAAVTLAGEMLHGRPLTIEVAAGLDDTTFGTDAVSIMQAIERADSPAGVVVLMDLGSAVLSAELALDLLQDSSIRDRVTLSPAPLVEGLIVAAVAAAGGASREEVAAEARNAVMGKAAHLSTPEPGVAPEPEDQAQAAIVGVFPVANPHGLHARPAARLVSEVRALDASVQLRNLTTGAGPVPAASLSRVATLTALHGHEVEVRATGPQAQEAVEHVLALAKRRFDEPPEQVSAPPAPPRPTPSRSGPLAASPGIAVGPVRRLAAEPVDPALHPAGEPAQEWRRVLASVAAVRREIEHVRVLTERELGPDQASIFDAHLSLLTDTELLGDVKARIRPGTGAVAAWAGSLAEVERQWAELPDPYLRERAADVRAVGEQVLQALTGQPARRMTGEGVLVASDLTPAETAGLDLALVTGVVLAQGSPTSHAAILARARDIPVVVAAGPEVLGIPEGRTILLDGATGALHLDPAPELIEEYQSRAAEAAEQRVRQVALADHPAVSRDGTRILVAANLGSVSDARAALAAGADGAGLVRTEFLFLDRTAAPDINEQQDQYDSIAEAMEGRRITLRTLDVGGDKPLPYLPMPPEANPFLGQRGIRLSLRNRDLLRDQMAAICHTARHSPTSIMLPMVSTPDELIEARQVLVEAAGSSGLPAGLHIGTMIEVPSAALKIEALLPYVDFVSIGTNDLTQYTLAAERGNGAVAALSDALDPGVLRLIDHVCRAASGRVDVAVCGEAASDELAIPILVGLGVRELSVSPPAVARVKAAIRQLDVEHCASLAGQALTLPGATDVRKLVLATMAETQGDAESGTRTGSGVATG